MIDRVEEEELHVWLSLQIEIPINSIITPLSLSSSLYLLN